MIEILTKIHDRFSIEFKLGFVTRRKLRDNDFSLYMWIFVPSSIDINSATYPKSKFYQDVKSYIRLITPKFLLREIVGVEAIPYKQLRTSFETLASNPTRTNTAEYEYQIKMFAAIVKSSLREEMEHICEKNQLIDDTEELCLRAIDNITAILSSYRALRKIINTPSVSPDVMEYFFYGDDFISTMSQRFVLRLLKFLQKDSYPVAEKELRDMEYRELEYRRKMKYSVIDPRDPSNNRDLVFRYGVLKKYIESILFLNVPKKRDGVLVEQLYYSIAAGFAMLFATVVSFAFQKTYGSLTLPLFIALIISYMLKDRIKELMRYYFAHRIGSKYFDNKAAIKVKEEKIGSLKEGMDFIPESKVPEEVRRVRYNKRLYNVENRQTDEKVILYRKVVRIDRERLSECTSYKTLGINDIIRLQVNSFIQKMDNPQVNLLNLSPEGKVENVACDKMYYINIVIQTNYAETAERPGSEFRRFRIALTRDGIDSIEEIKAQL